MTVKKNLASLVKENQPLTKEKYTQDRKRNAHHGLQLTSSQCDRETTSATGNVVSVLLGRGTDNFNCRIVRNGRVRNREPKRFAIRVWIARIVSANA